MSRVIAFPGEVSVFLNSDNSIDFGATLDNVRAVLTAFQKERETDSETIKTYAEEVYAEEGLSLMPRGRLIAGLHAKMGSTSENWTRNDAKILANLGDFAIGSVSGMRLASPEEVAALRLVKLARKEARAAAKTGK